MGIQHAVRADVATKVHAVNPNLFRHEMLEYAGGPHGFVERARPLIELALSQGAPVLVAVRGELGAPLAEELGGQRRGVRFADMREIGRNPARIIPEWQAFLDAECNGGPPPLGIGEPVWPGRCPPEIEECMRHEDLLNLAFAGQRAWSLLCPYDLDGLPDEVIEQARHSHVALARDPACAELLCPADRPARPFAGTLAPPPAGSKAITFDRSGLGEVRSFVRGCAAQTLGEDLTAQLVLAINELATNSVQYGGGSGTLIAWSEGDAIICEVRDAGQIREPLAGRRHPSTEQRGGRGLWLVNQLCDLVQIRSSPGETAVRVRMHAARA